MYMYVHATYKYVDYYTVLHKVKKICYNIVVK